MIVIVMFWKMSLVGINRFIRFQRKVQLQPRPKLQTSVSKAEHFTELNHRLKQSK